MARANMLDQLIGWFSPGAGVKRLAARRAMDLQTRAYAAGRRDHRTKGWQTAGTSGTAEAMGAADVRARVRALMRDNGYAVKALNSLVDHVVGTGILGTPKGKRAATLWSEWQAQADFDGHHDWHGLQALALRAMFTDGDVLIVRKRAGWMGGPPSVVPLQLQVLEADYLDTGKTGALAGGGEIDRGIEYDADGRKVAYWLFRTHPGDMTLRVRNGWLSDRVPAEDVIQLFDRVRPGQDRGVSVFAPAVMTFHELQMYMEAERVRKRIESCLAGFITSDDDNISAAADGQVDEKAAPGLLVEKFIPGMLMRLRGGEDVKLTAPMAASGIGEFTTVQLREIAAGCGVMYEMLTGDFSHVNYSSWRAGNHGFQRRIESWQWLLAVPLMCARVERWWNEAAGHGNLLSRPAVFSWEPPGFVSVDPYKDAQADLLNLRNGTVLPSELAARRGWNYIEFLAQYAQDLADADAAFTAIGGAQFDGDPRKQKGQQNAASDDAGDKPAAG